MTVAELIEKLKTLPADLPVITEGCDCDAAAGDVILVEADRLSGAYVSIERDPEHRDGGGLPEPEKS